MVHIFGRMDVGGAELRTVEAVEIALTHESSLRHIFVTLKKGQGRLDSRIVNLGAEVTPVPLSPLFPVRFLAFLCSRRPVAVHSHVLFFSGVILALAAVARVPVRIAHIRTAPTQIRPVDRLKRMLMLASVTHIVAVSQSAMTAAIGRASAGNRRVHVIVPTGPQATSGPGRYEHTTRPATPTLVQVGRLAEVRDQLRTIQLVSLVRANHGLDLRLRLVGSGSADYESLLREKAASLGLLAHIDFCGQVNPPHEIIAQSTAMISLARREGLPGAILEALSIGTPVIALGIPSVEEVTNAISGVTSIPITASDHEAASLLASFVRRANSMSRQDRQVVAERYASSDHSRGSERLATLWENLAAEATSW